MANNKKSEIKIPIAGDTTGLQKAIDKSTSALDKFGKNAGGTVNQTTSTVNTGLSKMSMAMTGLGAAAAVGAAAIGTAFAAADAAALKAFDTFQAASMSQMGLEQIQKMANMYAEVGLTMEQIADHQKDLKDRIGDAITNTAGSMYTDVIQPLKLNVLELQKMADAGEDVYAKIYFAAKAQGMSLSQITNMFETMGNDATKRLTVLRQYNDEQVYQQKLAGQNVQLTEEQSKAFEEYRKATNELSIAWESWKNSALAPVAGFLTTILNLLNKINNTKPPGYKAVQTSDDILSNVENEQRRLMPDVKWQAGQNPNSALMKKIRAEEEALKEQLGLALDVAQGTKDVMDKTAKEFADGSDKGTLTSVINSMQTDAAKTQGELDALTKTYKETREAIKLSLNKAYAGNEKAMQADLAKLDEGYAEKSAALKKKINGDASKDAEKNAKKALAAKNKELRDIATAQRNWEVIISEIAENSNEARLQVFDRQQKQMQESIRTTGAILKKSQAEIDVMLEKAKASAAQARTEIFNQQIGMSNPNEMSQNISAYGTDNLTGEQTTFLANQNFQNAGLSTNPFGAGAAMQQQSQMNDINAQEEEALRVHEMLLAGTEDYERQRFEIEQAYAAKRRELETQNAQAQLTTIGTMATDIGSIFAGALGEQNAAARSFFAMSKGIAIAQSVISIQQGIAEAMKLGFPAGLAAAAKVATQGASIMSTIKGTNIKGQAHSGIEEVPGSLGNDSTWILQAGERVVSRGQNKQLQKFLDSNESGNSGSGETTINAPFIVNGNVDGADDRKFNEMVKKHANMINQAVIDAQKRSS